MSKHTILTEVKKLLPLVALLLIISCKPATEKTSTGFPKPQTKGGKPLLNSLADRVSTRAFSDKKISDQTLSDLLWAANGVNRAGTNGRTAPSANNKQEIDIYVANESGLYLFDALQHQLKKVKDQDIRAKVGKQDYVPTAPTILILVANLEKTDDKDSLKMVSGIDAGYVSQNIYLYCSAFNMATVAVAWMNYEELPQLMGLNNHQRLLLAHPVGYKK